MSDQEPTETGHPYEVTFKLPHSDARWNLAYELFGPSGERWINTGSVYWFASQKDAALFVLCWGGESDD